MHNSPMPGPSAVERPFLKGLLTLLMPVLIDLLKGLLSNTGGATTPLGASSSPQDLEARLKQAVNDYCK